MWQGVYTSGSWTTDEVTYYSPTGQKLAIYGLDVIPFGGNYNSPPPQLYATPGFNYYYFGGRLIGKDSSSGTTVPVVADRLGSIGHYYPYGQEKPSATQNGTEKFTGYLRDTETGLDYAINRYHNPGTGRFLTPDFPTANPKDPGSWNRYAYVGGDPVNRVDRNGTDYCEAFGDGLSAGCDTTGDCFELDPDSYLLDPSCMNPVPAPCGVDYFAGAGGGCTPEPIVSDSGDDIPQPDCTITLGFRPVMIGPINTGENHAFILLSGSRGTSILEGDPQHFGLGFFGTLQGNVTTGINGYENTDNASNTMVTQDGSMDDPDCVFTDALLGIAYTPGFNKASGAPYGGWTYSPIPNICLYGTCANSNSYASFLLWDVGINFDFPHPPNTPGWGSLDQ